MSRIGNFFCINCSCGEKLKNRDFQIPLDASTNKIMVCPNNVKLKLKLMGEMCTTFMIDKAKHAKGRTETEKRKRSTEHFEKEILPTLGGTDKKHFEKKRELRKRGKIK